VLLINIKEKKEALILLLKNNSQTKPAVLLFSHEYLAWHVWLGSMYSVCEFMEWYHPFEGVVARYGNEKLGKKVTS
jgi:hypothetical protein